MDINDLIPLLVIQGTFQIAALAHLIYKKKTQNLNYWAWVVIIIIGGILGPIFYFTMGRDDS